MTKSRANWARVIRKNLEIMAAEIFNRGFGVPLASELFLTKGMTAKDRKAKLWIEKFMETIGKT